MELILRFRGTPVARLAILVPGHPEFDSGRFAPLVEYRVERIEVLDGYHDLQPTLRAAGEAILVLGGRRGETTPERRREAQREIAIVDQLREEMDLIDLAGRPLEGRVTMIAEVTFGRMSLPAVALALAPNAVMQ